MASANPYQAPGAAVADAGGATQPVRLLSTSGRIGRVRYMAYGVGVYIAVVLLMGLGAAIGGAIGPIFMIIGWAGALILGFMLTIQRAHDFNWAGWTAILMFVPLIQFIFLIMPGTDGENRWGPPTPPNSVLVLIGAWFLVAIPIIGIIAAVTLPAYQDYQKRAKDAQTQKK